MNSHHYGLILAGGRGTRFWPKSRKRNAKQVLNVAGERSLIQATVDRLAPAIAPERIWVLTNDLLRDVIIRQLPEVPKRQILAEPAPRNTAPAIGLAAQILHAQDKDAIMGVFPADHVIGRPAVYRAAMKAALRGAAEGKIMVVGIKPRWPEPGYGYVEFPRDAEPGVSARVKKFHEKPELPKAKRYFAAGNYFWNSGMFFWRCDVVLDELRKHLPKTATILASLPRFGSPKFGPALGESFPRCENISIDFAVLEKAKEVHGIASADFGWNDVGSWNAVYELQKRDSAGNAILTESVTFDSSDNFVDAKGKLVALLGVNGLIIVDTPDALLIASRDRAQQVGDVVKALEKMKREDLL